MSWDWPGRDVGGGWTRLQGTGSSVAYDPPAESMAPVVLATPEAPTEPEVELIETAPGWEAVPDEPIVAFAAEQLGFPLWPGQASILSGIYRDAIRTAVLRLGRRSGKDRSAAVLATFEATVNADAHLAHVPEGEQIAIAVVATSQRQARVAHRYVRGFLSKLGSFRNASGRMVTIVRDSEDEIELSNGIVILTLPCTARSTRGLAVAVLILDEAAWMIDSDGSPLAAKEIWDSLAPSVAQFPEGKIVVLSTPRWTSGWFSDLCRQAASGIYGDMRQWWATTRQMNPLIGESFLEQEQAKDPVSFRREYEAAFTSGIGAVFADELVRAAIVNHPPSPIQPGRSYAVSIDAAYTRDTFALAAGMMVGDRLEVRHVQGWSAEPGRPVDHRATLDAVAAVSRAHNRAPVILDQFASEPVAQGLTERGVAVLRRPWTNESKGDAVTVVRQLLHQSRLAIPRHGPLISQLVSYEQTTLPTGRARYAAPPGGHDDYCSALLGLAHHLALRGGTGSTAESWIA